MEITKVTVALSLAIGAVLGPVAMPASATVEEPEACSLELLRKGAKTRAGFSDFAGEKELLVNVERCDYSGADLSKEVLSGIRARGANFSKTRFGREASRADFRGANLRNSVMVDANLYESRFDGADLSGADLSNAIASGASFGKDAQSGEWANLAGTQFEGALLSTSDVQRICLNPTLDDDGRASLGCRD